MPRQVRVSFDNPGLQDKLYLGDLDSQREWGFTKDYVEGMWMMLQADQAEDFVFATGQPHTIRQFLDFSFGYLDLDWNDCVQIDPRYLRPTEGNMLKSDYSKAKTKLGREPKTDCQALAELMVDHDLELAREEATKSSLAE